MAKLKKGENGGRDHIILVRPEDQKAAEEILPVLRPYIRELLPKNGSRIGPISLREVARLLTRCINDRGNDYVKSVSRTPPRLSKEQIIRRYNSLTGK